MEKDEPVQQKLTNLKKTAKPATEVAKHPSRNIALFDEKTDKPPTLATKMQAGGSGFASKAPVGKINSSIDFNRLKMSNSNLSIENSIREIDFKFLETMLMKDRIQAYNKALEVINDNWAK